MFAGVAKRIAGQTFAVGKLLISGKSLWAQALVSSWPLKGKKGEKKKGRRSTIGGPLLCPPEMGCGHSFFIIDKKGGKGKKGGLPLAHLGIVRLCHPEPAGGRERGNTNSSVPNTTVAGLRGRRAHHRTKEKKGRRRRRSWYETLPFI